MVNPVAPRCPQCGSPVTDESATLIRHSYGSPVVWNESWWQQPPRCFACGFELQSDVTVKTGHSSPVQEGHSQIQIQPGVSLAWTFLDYLDYRPFIEIQISRTFAAESGGLAQQERIRLTPEEWQAIAAQLQGPLQPLVHQQSWWIDMT